MNRLRREGWAEQVDSELALPRSIEDGAKPPADLSGFEPPTIVVVIPFEHATEAKAAA
jgi:hypothetical protein